MSDNDFPSRLVRGIPVVAAPGRLDTGNAGLLRAALAWWIAHGHATIVVDLGRTRHCDQSAVDVLTSVHRWVQAEGGGLRMAHGGRRVHRAVLDQVLEQFASVAEAVAELPAVVIEPVCLPTSAAAYQSAGSAL